VSDQLEKGGLKLYCLDLENHRVMGGWDTAKKALPLITVASCNQKTLSPGKTCKSIEE